MIDGISVSPTPKPPIRGALVATIVPITPDISRKVQIASSPTPCQKRHLGREHRRAERHQPAHIRTVASSRTSRAATRAPTSCDATYMNASRGAMLLDRRAGRS